MVLAENASSSVAEAGADRDEIRVMIVDDHGLLRSGIRHSLGMSDGIRVVAEAEDGHDALRQLAAKIPDLLLLDVHMPKMDGLTCLDRVAAEHPEVRVIMLSFDDNKELALDALRRGASGFVVKSIRPTDLAAVVRQAAHGNVILGRLPAPAAASHDHRREGLTGREREILQLLSQGKNNQEIAGRLYVTSKTVKYHLTNLYAKLGVGNRTEATSYALTHGLLD